MVEKFIGWIVVAVIIATLAIGGVAWNRASCAEMNRARPQVGYTYSIFTGCVAQKPDVLVEVNGGKGR